MSMARSVAGLEFARTDGLSEEVGTEAWCCVGFPSEREAQTNDPFSSGLPRGRAEAAPILSEFFSSFRKKDCKLLVSFIPARMEELDHERASYEKRLSKEHAKSTERGSHHPDIAFGASQLLDLRKPARLRRDGRDAACCGNSLDVQQRQEPE